MGVNWDNQVRINNPITLDRERIENKLLSGSHVIVQFSEPSYYEALLQEVDEICAQYDEKFGVRFYGHYSLSFDCNVVLQIPNVKTLYVDCLVRVHNTEALAGLKNLYYLNLNIFELEDTNILKMESLQSLRMLALNSEKKPVNLSYLQAYTHLKKLIVGGKVKNLETVGHLSNLEFLSLNSISKISVKFINNLDKLKTLKLILGGRENIREIEGNEIETLEIVRVRGFNDLQNISCFTKLRRLKVEDQIQLTEVNFVEELENLEEITIINCKGLTNLTGLDKLSSLQTLRIYKTSIDFNSFMHQKFPNLLSNLYFFTAKSKQDEIIQRSLFDMGFQMKK